MPISTELRTHLPSRKSWKSLTDTESPKLLLPGHTPDYSYALIRRLRVAALRVQITMRLVDDAGRSLFRRCKVELPRPFLIEECAFSFVATAPMFVAARDQQVFARTNTLFAGF